MLEPYIDRLDFICDMLNSPQGETVQEAYDLLFKLWAEYSADAKFIAKMKNIIKSCPTLMPEFVDHLNQSNLVDDEKTILLERIKLLYPPNEKGDERIFDANEINNHMPLKTINLFLSRP